MNKGDVLVKKQKVDGQVLECKILSSYPDGEYMLWIQIIGGEKTHIRKSFLLKHWREAKRGIQLRFI